MSKATALNSEAENKPQSLFNFPAAVHNFCLQVYRDPKTFYRWYKAQDAIEKDRKNGASVPVESLPASEETPCQN